MSLTRVVPRFLGADGQRVFTLLRHPMRRGASCMLVVPPFAEEMNKSRRMIAEVGSALAQRGIGSILVDLYGTGDSEGEFADADWARWKADLRQTIAWCSSEGLRVDRLLGIRLGCALGAEVVRESLPTVERTVFWQPVLDGARFLDQFLRLRVAASMMEQDRKETTAELRARLANGEAVEIAGYDLSAALATQLDQVRLADVLTSDLGALHWMEIVRSANAPLPLPAAKAVEVARAAGVNISVHAIAGEPFWSAVEIVRIPALIEGTVAALEGA